MKSKEEEELNDKLCETIGIEKQSYIAMGEECEGNYPNLFEPNNFIKLIECKTPSKSDSTLFAEVTSIAYFFSRHNFELNVRYDFLNMLLHFFNGYSDDWLSLRKQKRLKETIRSIKWED